MAALPEDMSIAIDELETAIAEIESRLETARAERDEAKGRQVELEIENANLRRELALARERQGASADIIGAIASAPGNAAQVLQQIAETTARLFGAPSVSIQLAENGEWASAYRFGDSAVRVRSAVPIDTIRIGGPNLPGTVIAENRQIHIPDLDDLDPAIAHWPGPPIARAAGTRVMCGTPLRRADTAIGVLVVYRDRPLPFTAEELTLLQSFADQAVIAIENARLIRETREALERQTAIADVLKVIASSPSDVRPVFEAIASSAKRLLGGFTARVLHFRGDQLHLVAFTPTDPEADEGLKASFPLPVADFAIFGLVRDGATLQFPDTEAENVPPMNRELGRIRGFRSVLFVPLMNQGEAVGILSVTRTEPGAFAEHHVQLLQTFADQAVIAIENTRLFNETQEALERQTATADVLKVIASSPSDVQPVFETIVSSGARLFAPCAATITTLRDGQLHWDATAASIYNFDVERVRAVYPVPFDPNRVPSAQAMLERRIIAYPDIESPDTPEITRKAVSAGGFRSITFVPLVDQGRGIGTILFTHPEAGFRLSDRQLALVQTFADQAVIAIKNTRLFNETQEALERQTATADILKVIASSPSDVQPVFDAIADSANRLIGGFSAAVFRFIDRDVHLTAFTPIDPAADEALKRSFPQSLSGYPPLAMIKSGETVQIADTEALQDMQRDIARARGFRSVVISPLMSNGLAIGSINVTRADPGAFAPHHIQLLQTFADQAVIAIENTRLFNETREALERQTATADILKVIASSPSDVQPVFDAIASSAKRLLGGFSAAVFRYVDGMVQLAAFTPTHPAADQALRADFPTPVDDFAAFRLAAHGQPFPIPDTEEVSHAPVREIARLHGFRSMLWVPMVNGGVTIGVLSVTRAQPGSFAPHQTQLLQTFADQAVIAIENTRLFNETQEALERQTATAEILKVIASSPSDVQPVFEAIAANANRLVGGFSTAVHRIIDDVVHLMAFTPINPEADEAFKAQYPRHRSKVPAVALVQNGETAQYPDSETANEHTRNLARARGWRSSTITPLMNQGVFIGYIACTRREPGLLAEHHVQLLRTFADQAVIAIENARLFNETQEALERQTATADILKVIASSPSDVQPVFDAIAHSAKRLIGGFSTAVHRIIDDIDHLAAFTPTTPESDEILQAAFPRPLSEVPAVALGVNNGETAQIADSEAADEQIRTLGRARGWRSATYTPLMNQGTFIGFIVSTRREPGLLADRHVQLLRTFADQAVIAIENTRLFNETKEALERQTATADILKVIASSPSDVQPVFDAIATSAKRLLSGFSATVYRFIDGQAHLEAFTPTTPEADDILTSTFPRPVVDFAPFRMTQTGEVVQVPDTEDPSYELSGIARARGYRSMLFAPLMSKGASIGFIAVTRVVTGTFSDHHVQLLRTFADQAIIAIENTRLFNEVQARTEDLSEALQQQTATADVLKVISRSAFDLEIVLDTLTASAASLCNADVAAVTRPHPEGGYHHATRYNFSPEWERMNETVRLYPGRGSLIGRVLLEGKAVQIPDAAADPEYAYPEQQRVGGYRTLLGVPLLREGQPTGVLLLGRTRVEPFTDRQIELVQTYADQAVIAIENVRLFDEVQARTRDLSEALTYQTGSANILRVIASSPTDVQPVLTAIVENACAVCDANDAIVFLEDGGELRSAAHHGPIPEGIVALPITPTRVVGRTFILQTPVHVRDLQSEEGAEFPDGQELALRFGHRTVLAVPLLRDGKGVGVIMLRRNEVQPFSNEQIRQLQTFADQAVIAIGNVRLFEEVQAKTRDLTEALTYQTGSANILKVIASSPTDINPVLNSIVESACELCGAYDAVLRLKHGDELTLAAHRGMVPADWQLAEINPFWTAGRAILEQRPIHVHDMSSSEGDEFPQAQARALEQGHRTILSIPLLREGNSVGSLTLRRLEVNPFTDKQIALLQTFADQAVIAIGNVRLFEEVQAKTRDLTEALTYQTGSANILRVIASSPTDVKPVLQAIVESACELCDAYDAMLRLKNGDHLDFSAHHGPIPVVEDSVPISRNWTAGLAVIEQKTVHVHDLLSSEGDAFPGARERARRFDLRTILTVPLLREGESIGAIMLRRNEVMPFTEKQIALLQTFADQAVIAIGNVRLFEEVQAKTRDLSEALTYQTGSANILKVIASSPTDIKPVFQAIVESACELCDAYDAVLRLKDGDNLCFSAHHGPISTFTHERPINRDWSAGRAVIDQNPVQIADLLSPEGDEFSEAREIARQLGHRTVLSVPLLREG